MAQPSNTAFVLVHGSWHGSWCWDLVSQHLNLAGHQTVAIDLPGHGLNAVPPKSFLERPLDAEKFGTEVSPLAGISTDEYADAVIAGAERALAAGAEKVYAVGHSMGGVPITFAAAKAPEKFAGLVYVTAFAPTPGKPAGAYLELEDQHNNTKIGDMLLADFSITGSLRIDPRSTDADYLAKLKAAAAADVSDERLAAINLMCTPDAPAAMYGEVANFDERYAALKRHYIRCTNDCLIVPSTQAAMVADMNAAWPESKTDMVDIASSHEVIFSQPEELARLIAAAL